MPLQHCFGPYDEEKIAPAAEPSACKHPKEPVNGFGGRVEVAGAGAPVVASASKGSPRPRALSASMQPKWPTTGIETPTPPPGSGTGAKSAKIVNRHGPTALLRPTGDPPNPRPAVRRSAGPRPQPSAYRVLRPGLRTEGYGRVLRLRASLIPLEWQRLQHVQPGVNRGIHKGP
jgi:hypothetical protein